MKYFFFLLLTSLLINCAVFQPKTFTQSALDEKLVTLDKDSISFQEILNRNVGKEKFVQIFASYCQVSQNSFKDVLQFQKENPEKEYIFLSVDHNYYDWKRSLEYVKPKGQFYYIPKKDEGALGKFLKIKSIPRFLHIDKNGKINVYNTAKVSDKLK